METIVLVFEGAAPNLDEIARLMRSFPIVQRQPHQVFVADGENRVFIRSYDHRSMHNEGYFWDWPVERIPLDADGLAIDYRSVPFAKRIIDAFAAERSFFFDANQGEVYTVEGFRRRCQQDSDWDWTILRFDPL